MNHDDIKPFDFIHVKSNSNEHWLVYIIDDCITNNQLYHEGLVLPLKKFETVHHDKVFPIFDDDTVYYMSREEKQLFVRQYKNYKLHKEL